MRTGWLTTRNSAKARSGDPLDLFSLQPLITSVLSNDPAVLRHHSQVQANLQLQYLSRDSFELGGFEFYEDDSDQAGPSKSRNSMPSPTPSERTVSSKHSSVNLEGSLFFPWLKDEQIPTPPSSSELHSPQPPLIPSFDSVLTSLVQPHLSSMPSLPNPNDRKAPSFSADEPENLLPDGGLF